MNSDEEYVSFFRIFFMTQAYQYQQSLQTKTRNSIFREHELAKERLWDDHLATIQNILSIILGAAIV